ncbi:DEAD/DEAH box helicase [Suttonella sp. R2A3]|uniref:DEAD/DEAH box helicase n=1 Tax=Suttonella sp. R2A3 TaxID=2908648 RepID=UPI0038FC07A7
MSDLTFDQLSLAAPLLKALHESGYSKPTPIQAQAIPFALEGRDLLLSAQTGSGKTAAFVLPVLDYLINDTRRSKKPRVLILTPTRELALQVNDSVRRYGNELKWLFSVPLVGGAPYGGQIRALKKGVQIIIATPGRLLDHMRDGRVDFSELNTLILDEADRMLDMGFSDDINAIIDAAPAQRQTIMSSATWDGPVGKIAATFTRNPERIAIKTETAHIEERVYFCDDLGHKNKVLERLVCDPDMTQTIIFTATKRSCEEVADTLRDNGHRARFLHGDLPQHKRNRIVEDLRKGKCDILVATDVAARGIDIPAISHVINYDLPRQVEDYVHRIGRSGRAGRSGMAMNLCSLADRAQLASITRYLKREISEEQLEGLEPRKTAAAVKAKKPKGKYRGKGGQKARRGNDGFKARGQGGRGKPSGNGKGKPAYAGKKRQSRGARASA